MVKKIKKNKKILKLKRQFEFKQEYQNLLAQYLKSVLVDMVRMHLAQFFFLEMMLWNHLKHQCLAEDDRGTHHTYTVNNETKVFMKLHLHFHCTNARNQNLSGNQSLDNCQEVVRKSSSAILESIRSSQAVDWWSLGSCQATVRQLSVVRQLDI